MPGTKSTYGARTRIASAQKNKRTGQHTIIALYSLNADEQEAFIQGFAEAARLVFPDYDPDVDSLSLRPFCRPWDAEPVCLDLPAGEPLQPHALGQLWFELEQAHMAASCAARSENTTL